MFHIIWRLRYSSTAREPCQSVLVRRRQRADDGTRVRKTRLRSRCSRTDHLITPDVVDSTRIRQMTAPRESASGSKGRAQCPLSNIDPCRAHLTTPETRETCEVGLLALAANLLLLMGTRRRILGQKSIGSHMLRRMSADI